MSRNLAHFLTAILLMIVVSFAFLFPELGAVALIVGVMCVGSVMLSDGEVEIVRDTGTTNLHEGDDYVVTYTIRSRGFYGLILVDDITGRFGVFVRPGIKRVVRRRKMNRFGRYEDFTATVRIRDLFGFREEMRHLSGPGYVKVHPRWYRMERLRFVPRRTKALMGDIPSRYKGHGFDFHSLREYVAGDDARRINWKASARYQRLIVNETMQDRVGDVVIVVDLRELGEKELAVNEIYDAMIRGAASLAHQLLKGRNRVGMVVAKTTLSWAYGGFGRHHFYKILNLLGGVDEPGESELSFEHVSTLILKGFTASHFIMIAPKIDWEMEIQIARLVARGCYGTVILPLIPGRDRAARLYNAIRTIPADELSKHVEVKYWPINTPIERALI